MKQVKSILIAAIILFIALGTQAQTKQPKTGVTAPPVIIYKTKHDYSHKVPVTLSADKSKIISYPAPQDILRNGDYAYPTPLASGYLLDNRGVNPNTAFLNLTYEEYAKMKEVPNLQDLYSQIQDKKPICRMYELGKRNEYKDLVNDLNDIIKHNKLKNYKKLK